MNCTTPSAEELRNAVSNNKAIYNVTRNQTQSVTDEYLNHTKANFEKRNGQYQTTTGETLETTITTEISKRFEKQNPGLISDPGFQKIVQAKANVGTFVHTANETILNHILSSIRSMSVEDAISFINNSSWDQALLPTMTSLMNTHGLTNAASKDIFESLHDGAKQILLQVYNRQKYINKRLGTNGNVKIYVEQPIIDAINDIGGTADMIAVYSDNTASVFDFKTKIPKKSQIDAKGNLVTDKFVGKSDKERYKAQLSSIQRILVQRYGVRQVVQSRIVPIQINIPFDRTSGTYNGKITGIFYGDKQSPYLAQLAPLPELTGFKDLDEFLTNLEKKIKNYENKAKIDKDNREYYKNKIKDLTEAKVNILVKHSFNDLVQYATRLIDELAPSKLENLTIEQLRDAKDELKALTQLASATYDYRKALSTNPGNDQLVNEIKIVIESLTSAINDRLYEVEQELYNVRVADAIQKLTGYNVLDESGNFIPINDEGFFGKFFNQLSQYDNPIFKAFRSKLSDAQFAIREKVKKLTDTIVKTDNELRKWMKENGKNEQWLINALIDRDPASPDVDNLFSKISKEFKAEIKEAKESGDVNFILSNFEPSDGYTRWFEKASDEMKQYFIGKHGDNSIAQSKYNEWLSKHNLALNNGKPVNPDAWVTQFKKGKLKRTAAAEQRNLSKEYKYIQSIPQLLAYYNLFETCNSEFRKILGIEYYKLPANFLPNIRKSNIDRLLDNGIVNGTKDVLNNLMQELNVREDDLMYGEIDPETGSLKKTIPRFFINQFKDKQGNVVVGEKSYDLTKSLIIFSKMAYNYQEMNLIEGTVLAMRDFLAEKGEMVIKRGSTPLRDFVGNDLTTKIQGKQLEDIFQSFVDLYLYGVNVNPISDDSSGKYEKLILKAKQYFTLKALGLGFIPAAGSFLAAKTQAAIEGFKGQAYTAAQYKQAMVYGYSERQKFLALTGFFDPMGVEYDFFAVDADSKSRIGDPRERNKVKKYVNSRMLLRAFSAGDEYIDEVILASIAQNFYIDENNDLRRMRNDEEREQFASRSIWNMFSYDGEHGKLDIPAEKQKELIIKFREAAQSIQSKIKGVIPEEDKAYWQTQLVGQVVMHFKSWMPGVLRERFGKTKYNDALQLVEMGRLTAFGQEIYNYEQFGAVEFAKSILLPKLKDLLKHLVWYNGSGSNPRIRLAYEAWLDRNPHYRGQVSFEDFVSAQQAQMKALMIELRIILAMAMLIALLGADFDHDGKKFYQEMWITRKLVAILSKTNNEISFTYNPNEFANMIKNPIPLAGVLTDAVKLIGNTYDEGVDMTLGEGFPLPFHKPQTDDKTGIGYYTTKVVPGVSQLEKFLEIFEKEKPIQQ